MKTKLSILIGALIVLAFIIPGVSATGNGAMSGKHFNLNLISIKNIDQLPTNDETNNGNRIFVNFNERSKILLTQNWDGEFNVIDYIATRNDPAEFTLPAPENVYNEAGQYVGPGAYRIFVRVVGKPGGSGNLTTCAVDEFGAEDRSTDAVINLAKSSKFSDVTRELTTVLYDFDLDGDLERIDIFDPMFEQYLWAFDNHGLKNVQSEILSDPSLRS